MAKGGFLRIVSAQSAQVWYKSLLYMTRNLPVGLTLAVTLVTMFDSVGSGIYTGGTNNIMILHVCVAVFSLS